jgi:hypothetical protein
MDMHREPQIMRVPSFEQFAGWSRAAGIFIAGMIVGAAVFMSSVHVAIDEFITESQRLKMEMEMMHENAKTSSNEQRFISEIEVYLTVGEKIQLTPVTSTRLRKLITEDLTVLKGKRVYHTVTRSDDGVRLLRTLFKRVYPNVDGKDYIVEINHYSIVYGVLTVWATVEEFRPNNV